MNIKLVGHDYRYAVEQILFALFPKELPVYDRDGGGPARAEVSVKRGRVYAVATTVIQMEGKVSRGQSRAALSGDADRLLLDRLLQKIVKLSFYKAALPYIDRKPAWGALTGVRPAKLLTSMLESGLSEKAATRRLRCDYFVEGERAALCLSAAKASLEVKAGLRKNDIALYVGIPFCPTRCAYCSFVSHSVERSMKLVEPFLDALFIEIGAAGHSIREAGLNVVSVYIGGGTPTTLTPEQLDRLMQRLSASFDLSQVGEYTVEAGRPDTITPDKLAVMKRNGATRLSINPQSMSDSVLTAIGRSHSVRDVYTAMERARSAGFSSINMDLIAGLPGDTASGFYRSLDAVLSLAPENITVHTLALKRGARIKLEGTAIPGGEEVGEMLDYALSKLYGGGFSPYYLYRQKFTSGGFENVGWTRPGHQNLYNICMMEELCTVAALGAGGVTKLVWPSSGRIERIFNVKYPYEYIERIDKIARSKAELGVRILSPARPLSADRRNELETSPDSI